MEMNEKSAPPQTNMRSILSLVFGILTVLFFCTGLLPVPFTGFICFPLSFLFGLLALIFGLISLNQIRGRNETGLPMAWMGIVSGGFVFLCILCAAAAIAALFFFAPEYVPPVPFFDKYPL